MPACQDQLRFAPNEQAIGSLELRSRSRPPAAPTCGHLRAAASARGWRRVAVGSSPDNTAVVHCDGIDVLAISVGTTGGDNAAALIELGDTDIGRRSVEVTFTNPGAETGDTSGWTTTGTWAAESAEGNIAAPHTGTWYFSAGTDPAILEQTVDLVAQGVTAAELDSDATFDASVWAASEVRSDTRELRLQFLDGTGADIGTAFTTGEFGPNDGTWVSRRSPATSPPASPGLAAGADERPGPILSSDDPFP